MDDGRATRAVAAVTPTPDDGVRLTDETPWDEEARPTYEGTGPSYPALVAHAGHLIAVHDHLRGELAQVRDVVEQVRRGRLGVGAARSAISTMTLRQHGWALGAFCASYCQVVTTHHTLEDTALFPHLRRAEPGLGVVLDRLTEEHEVIHAVLDGVDRALVSMVSQDGASGDGAAALDDVQRAVDLLTDTLLSHLSYEERELVGPLSRHGMG